MQIARQSGRDSRFDMGAGTTCAIWYAAKSCATRGADPPGARRTAVRVPFVRGPVAATPPAVTSAVHRSAAARGASPLRAAAFVAACAGAVLVVLGAYANSLDNGFHFDDSHVVENNVYIRDLANLPRFFTDARTFSSIPANATYRPIISATLALDYARGGLAPRPYHVTQLTLLLAFGALLALAFHRVLAAAGPSPWHRWTALAAATLACVHTGNTQTVNYISARSELLAGIGVVGTLLLYAAWPRGRRTGLYLAPMVFGALAKTPAVMAAPLLFAYAALVERGLSLRELCSRRGWPRTRAALAATAPALLLAPLLYAFVEGMNPAGQTYGGVGRLRYLVTESWVWVRYAKLFVVPTGLSPDTDLEPFVSPWDPRVAAGIAFALLTLAWLASASRRREARAEAFGIAWFWLALVPSSTVFPLAEVANDHRVFLPFAGLALAVAAWGARRWSVARVPRPVPVRAAVAAVVVIALLAAHAVGTHRRNRAWRSEETLWADCVRTSPGNGRAWMNYGLTQMELGRYADAKRLFERAATLSRNYGTLEVNLAIVSHALGDDAAAARYFARGLALDPRHPAPHEYYARWLVQRGRAGEAVVHLEYALRLAPANIDVRHRLLELDAAAGAPGLAALARETLVLAPGDSIAAAYVRGEPLRRPATADRAGWTRDALALTGEGRHLEAVASYRMAVVLDSTDADALNNLGWSLAKVGFYDAALPWLRAAVRRSDDALAANNLAWALAQVEDARFLRAYALQTTGRPAEAAAVYTGLLAAHPRWANAHENLGHALAAMGRKPEADAEFRRARELRAAPVLAAGVAAPAAEPR